MTPSVSVVMSVYNDTMFLKECIQSILDQTLDDLEFIIVDDGSTDETPSLLRQVSDSRVQIITHSNKGLTESLNVAILHSTGKYIARQDAGDISYPQRLEKQFKLLEKNPCVGLVGCHCDFIDNLGLSKWTCCTPEDNDTLQKKLLSICQFAHPSIMMRKDAFVRVGGYRTLFKYAQDYDLWLRISEIYELSALPEILVSCRHSEEGISAQKIYHQTLYAGLAVELAKQRRLFGREIQQFGDQPIFPPVASLSQELQDKLVTFYIDHPDEIIKGLRDEQSSEDFEFLFNCVIKTLKSTECGAGSDPVEHLVDEFRNMNHGKLKSLINLMCQALTQKPK